MSTTADIEKLSHKERVLAFLSLIHPGGAEAAEETINDYDIFEEDDEAGNADNWLFNLAMIDDLAADFDAVIYTMFTEETVDKNDDGDTESLRHLLDDMAEVRDCQIDWGEGIHDNAFRRKSGFNGLLVTAARSFSKQGYSLWRDISPSNTRQEDGTEKFSGWVSQSKNDESLLALCGLLGIQVQRCVDLTC